MFKRITLLAVVCALMLSLGACSSEPAADQSKQAATPAPAPKPPEPVGPIYELTKDEVTSHPDWTGKNISILGAKIGDVTRNVEKDFGKLDNTRTLQDEYLTVYQNNGIFIYTFKQTGKIRRMEVTDLFAKQIADEKLKKILTGDLKALHEVMGQEDTITHNDDDNSDEYVYATRGFSLVKYKVTGKNLFALRFSEPKKP